MADRLTKLDLLWLAAFAGLSSLACALSADRVGVTYDESLYMTAGRQCWQEGSCGPLAVHGTMPLPIDVQMLLPYLRERLTGDPPADPVLSPLRLARAGNLVFWWGLLTYALLLGRTLGGLWAGRLAVALVAADPTWQAHAALATTDIAVSAAILALVYHAWVGRTGGRWRRLVLPGLVFGVALLTKLSAVLYGGLALVVVDLWHRAAEPAGRGFRRHAAGFVGTLAARGLIGVAVAVAYCGVDPQPDRAADRLRSLVPADGSPLQAWAGRNAERVPNFVVAFAMQAALNSTPSGGCFLLGTWHPTGVWYHNPVVIALKLPAAVLVAVVIALLRPRSLLNLPLVLAAVMLAASLASTRQIGVRLLFPPLALGVVGLAVALVRGWGRVGVGVGLLAATGTAVAAAAAWPHGLTYLNELAGGPTRAAERMADSNVDWGQGLPDLIRWHDDHGRPPLALWYFGTDPRADDPRFRRLTLAGGVEDMRASLGPTLLAVGHSEAALNPDHPPVKPELLRWLRGRPVVARTATFTVYDLRATE